MEKNLVEWIKTENAIIKRPLTRKEIWEAAATFRTTNSDVQLSKGWLDKFIARNSRMVSEGYIRTSIN